MRISLGDFLRDYVYFEAPDGFKRKLELSDREIQIINAAEELRVPPYVLVKGRSGSRIVVHPAIIDQLSK